MPDVVHSIEEVRPEYTPPSLTVHDTDPRLGQSEGGFTTEASSTHMEVPFGGTTEPSPGPYFGKRYYDHPVWMTLGDWLVGGGTEYDYNWRPSRDGTY